MAIKIKSASQKDLVKIQGLNLELFEKEKKEYDQTLSLDWTFGEKGTEYFKDSIKNKDACALIAKDGDKIIGYLIGWIKKKKNHCRTLNKQAELENMFVLERFRNQKIGSKLVDRFIKWAKDKKVDNIRVGLYGQNAKAVKFYKKHGFKDYTNILEINF